jgi:hypothetical protein
MGAQQQLGQRIIATLTATLIVMAGVDTYSQELSSAPKPFAGQFDKSQAGEMPSSASQASSATALTPVPGPFSPRRPLAVDADQIANGLSTPADQFRLGSGYIGIQTQKSLQTPDPIRRSDCPIDEDCTDYPRAPRLMSPKTTTIKSLRKPFIGLSITAPLRE